VALFKVKGKSTTELALNLPLRRIKRYQCVHVKMLYINYYIDYFSHLAFSICQVRRLRFLKVAGDVVVHFLKKQKREGYYLLYALLKPNSN